MSCSYQSHWTNFTYQSLHLNTFEDGAESGRGVGLCLGFQQKVLNANESYDSGEPGSETVSRFQKAPAREKEIKHKCDGDVGLCYLSWDSLEFEQPSASLFMKVQVNFLYFPIILNSVILVIKVKPH